jgi:hypothetical protein
MSEPMSMGLNASQPGMGQAPNRIAQPIPTPPSVSDRISNLEDRAAAAESRINRLELTAQRLVSEAQEYRNQLGLQPLPDDHFIS